jgi:hypothetical protein
MLNNIILKWKDTAMKNKLLEVSGSLRSEVGGAYNTCDLRIGSLDAYGSLKSTIKSMIGQFASIPASNLHSLTSDLLEFYTLNWTIQQHLFLFSSHLVLDAFDVAAA